MTTLSPPICTEEPLSILVVDDDAVDRQMLARMLRVIDPQQQRYRLQQHDGGDGLEACLREGGFDCCLLDHQLGARTGLQVLKAYTGLAEAVPVVMLTGLENESAVQQYLDQGAVEFLSKDDLNPRLIDRTIRYSVRQYRLRQELEAGRQRVAASERMAALGMITAGIAHEFNNLHAVVLGNVEYAATLIGEHPARRRLDHVVEVVERGARITRSLLRMAQLGSPLGETGCDAAVVAGEVARVVEPMLRVSRVELVQTVDSAWVAMEESELQQVLINLLVNALHAVAKVSTPCIQLSVVQRGDWVTVGVEDNGIGIPAANHDTIFQPFFTTKGAYDQCGAYPAGIEGTGLGLALCEHLVTRRGGTIALDSEAGTGASFTLTLPAATPGRQADESSSMLPIPDQLPRVSIVVVEPQAERLQLVTLAVTRDHRQVLPFRSGSEALAQIQASRPEVVIADWTVEARPGHSLIETLASQLTAEEIDLVVLCDESPPRESLEYLPFRSLRIVQRPVGTRRLDEVVSRIQSTRT